MKHYPFDTHAYVKKLVAAGVPEAQAEVHAEVLADTVLERVATRDDIQALREELHALEERMNQRFAAQEERVAGLEERMNQRFVAQEERFKTLLASSIKDLELRLTLRLGGMLAAAVAILAVLMRVL